MTAWTVLRPSADTRRVYCSSSTGYDDNDGSTYKTAVASLARAKELIRHGYPDRLLLRNGDYWTESLGHWTKSGRSASEPMAISSYGASPDRPLLNTNGQEGMFTQPGGGSPREISNLVVAGLHFQGKGENGLKFLVPGENVLVEDCYVEGYRVNALFQGYEGWLRNYRLHRSIIVDSDGSTTAHSQGLYAFAVDGLTLEQNLFDLNGHPADIHSHNIYLDNGNRNCELRGNIIARAGSHGVQMRSGGIAYNNLFVRNPIALHIGGGNAPEAGGIEFDARGNVIVEGANIDANNPRGWGAYMANIRSGRFESNLIAHSSVGAQPAALILDGEHRGETPPELDFGVHNVAFGGNVIHDWQGGVEVRGDVSGITQEGDNFGIEHNTTTARRFKDPNRSVASYHASLGGTASFDAWIADVRAQSRKRWKPRLMARAVNSYLRDGFNLGFP